MKNFKIITDSGCDLSYEIISSLDIGYLGFVCSTNNKEIVEDCGKTITYKEFYNSILENDMPKTGQVNPSRFYIEFEKYVSNDIPILYISFSSALSGTYSSSLIAKDEILEKYPNGDITIIDTKSASSGQGLIVYKAAKLRNEGKTKEEVINWIEENKEKVHHYFSVSDLKHLERGGRVSSTSATIGTMLSIKPILHVDREGRLILLNKVRGEHKVLKSLFNKLEENLPVNGIESVFISHADDVEKANELANIIREKYNVKEIIINYMGLAVGTHTGKGAIGLYFIGNEKR